MPFYELSLVTKSLSKPETKLVLKRAAESILNAGAILRKIENVGMARPLPYKMSKDGVNYKIGSYFLYRFHSHSSLVDDLKDIYRRDIDIIHWFTVRIADPVPLECTLHDELQPPAYRPDVLKMIAITKQKKKPIFFREKIFELKDDPYPL